eukprot:COSAG02_NODE_42_length_46522_cov_109.704478_17_plen_71_part_00
MLEASAEPSAVACWAVGSLAAVTLLGDWLVAVRVKLRLLLPHDEPKNSLEELPRPVLSVEPPRSRAVEPP